ncbi:hypothetical protein ATKI12_5173 [Kitasatospora sp. Ki12]
MPRILYRTENSVKLLAQSRGNSLKRSSGTCLTSQEAR